MIFTADNSEWVKTFSGPVMIPRKYNRYGRRDFNGHLTGDLDHENILRRGSQGSKDGSSPVNRDDVNFKKIFGFNFRTRSYDVMIKEEWYWSSESDIVFPTGPETYFSLNTVTCDMRYMSVSKYNPSVVLPTATEVKTEVITSHLIYEGECRENPFGSSGYTMIVGLDFIQIGNDCVTIYKRV